MENITNASILPPCEWASNVRWTWVIVLAIVSGSLNIFSLSVFLSTPELKKQTGNVLLMLRIASELLQLSANVTTTIYEILIHKEHYYLDETYHYIILKELADTLEFIARTSVLILSLLIGIERIVALMLPKIHGRLTGGQAFGVGVVANVAALILSGPLLGSKSVLKGEDGGYYSNPDPKLFETHTAINLYFTIVSLMILILITLVSVAILKIKGTNAGSTADIIMSENLLLVLLFSWATRLPYLVHGILQILGSDQKLATTNWGRCVYRPFDDPLTLVGSIANFIIMLRGQIFKERVKDFVKLCYDKLKVCV